MIGNREAAVQELAKAEDNEREAAYAIAGGFSNMAANRLYYAVFHYIKYVLLSADVKAKSHKGAQAKFRELYLRPGTFPPSDNDLIAELWSDRQDADYAYFVDLRIEELRKTAPQVTAFGERCRAVVDDAPGGKLAP